MDIIVHETLLEKSTESYANCRLSDESEMSDHNTCSKDR